jgi:hypothetical protein
MKICAGFMGRAWLLAKDGSTIEVEKHPTPKYQFDEIVDVVLSFGNDREQAIAQNYLDTEDESLAQQVLDIYYNNWCKVRTWGNFNEEVTFRINSDGYDWYRVIVDFLLDHPMCKNSVVTVESDKASGVHKTYWQDIPYAEAIDDSNATVLASQLDDRDIVVL